MLEARDVSFGFDQRVPLLERASLAIAPGEVVGLSGPSGCGKSTLGRLLAGHLRPDGGTVRLDNRPIPRGGAHPVQYLAQTPVFAMNPRWRIDRVLREAHDPSPSLRALFGVDTAWDERFPHELSAGQLHRVSILRALAPGTRFLVADEITAALDAIAQAEIWHALLELAAQRAIGILVVSHDGALLSRVASRQLLFARIAWVSESTAGRRSAFGRVSNAQASC